MAHPMLQLVIIVATLAAVAVATDAEEGLTLLQTHAGRVDASAKQKALPEVASLLSSSSDLMDAVQKEASQLEVQMAKVQAENAAALAKKKADFQQRLWEQDKENRAQEASNSEISQHIKAVESSNDDLQQQVKETEEKAAKLEKAFSLIQSRLNIAEDLVGESLNISNLIQDGKKADDVTVSFVEEAAQHEQASRESAPSSLLQLAEASKAEAKGEAQATEAQATEADPLGALDDPEEASTEARPAAISLLDKSSSDLNLDALSGGLAQLASQMKAGEKALKELFTKSYDEGAQKHVELMTAEAKLKEDLKDATAKQESIKHDLELAQKSLKYMDKRHDGLREYLEEILKMVQ